MRLRNLRLLLLLLCLGFVLDALPAQGVVQADSVADEILRLENVDIVYLQNGRQLIMNALAENNLSKVQSVTTLLEEKFQGTDVMPFWVGEQILLHLITGQYILPLAVDRIDSLLQVETSGYLTPPRDNLYNRMIRYAKQHQSQLEQQIQTSQRSEKEKAFLKVFLVFLAAQNDADPAAQERINSASDQFLSRFPESRFDTFLRIHIREKYVPSPWGFSFEFFSGRGRFEGGLDSYFSAHVPIGVAFDIFYGRVGLFLRDYIGVGGSVRRDFSYNGEWPYELALNVFLPEASVGYVFAESDHWKFIPFLGISSMDIAPPEAKQETHDVGLDFVTTYTYGLNLDLKLKASQMPIVSYRENSVWFLRFRLAMNHPTYTKRDPRFDGTMLYFTIGFGGFGRKLLRDY